MKDDPAPRIFISYRREDHSGNGLFIAFQIYEKLEKEFGEENVFFDIESIPPGENFRTIIYDAVKQANILLAVVGPDWPELFERKAQNGQDDYVLTEIESALKIPIRVIPVLVGSIDPENLDSVPSSIAEIKELHAMKISTKEGFDSDVASLIRKIREQYPGNSPHFDSKDENDESTLLIWFFTLGLILIVLFLIATLLDWI